MLRAFGGALYLAGALVMIYNLIKTAGSGSFLKETAAQAPALKKAYRPPATDGWHRKAFEWKPVRLLVFSLVVVAIGGIAEFIPIFLIESNIPTISSVRPMSALELHGRDIYIREGCNNCHSQMIRPFRSETERYGEYSKAGEFVYDHPFLWGSKRTGPDLMRIGDKYPDSWHYLHMLEPESMSPGSIMPPYPWLFEQEWDKENLGTKISAMRTLGVPYEQSYVNEALADAEKQAQAIVDNLAKDEITVSKDAEIVALIAYLQRLGTDIKVKNNEE